MNAETQMAGQTVLLGRFSHRRHGTGARRTESLFKCRLCVRLFVMQSSGEAEVLDCDAPMQIESLSALPNAGGYRHQPILAVWDGSSYQHSLHTFLHNSISHTLHSPPFQWQPVKILIYLCISM